MFPSFKNAWIKGWDFIKKESEDNIIGVCDKCPPLQKEEKFEFLERIA